MVNIPRFLANILPIAPQAFEAMAAASHLGIHGPIGCLITAAAAAIAGMELAKGHSHEKEAKETCSLAEQLVRQQGDWRAGLDKYLADHKIRLDSLDDEQHRNPLVKFALLLTGQEAEIKRVLRESKEFQELLLNEVLRGLDGILASADLKKLEAMAQDIREIKAFTAPIPRIEERLEVMNATLGTAADLAADTRQRVIDQGERQARFEEQLQELIDKKKQAVSAAPRGKSGAAVFTEQEQRIAERAVHSASAITRAQAEVVLGNFKKADEELAKAERVLEDAFAFYTAKGDRYYLAGEFDMAVLWYTAVVTLPEAPPDKVAVALISRGGACAQAGQAAAAIADFTAAIELSGAPTECAARALWGRGGLHAEAGHMEAAIADLSAAASLSGTSTEWPARALLLRGMAYGQAGRAEAAFIDYSAVIDQTGAPPDAVAMALINRGLLFAQVGDTEAEIADYSSAINLSGATPEQVARALVYRGTAYGLQRTERRGNR